MPELPLHSKELRKKIGEGESKKVYEHPKNKEKVVKVATTETAEFIGKTTEQEMRSEFYLTKILHLLYPDQFPNIHMIHNDVENGKLQSIHTRVGSSPSFYEKIKLFFQSDNTLTVEERKKIEKMIHDCYDIGIHLDRMPHKMKDNYLFTDDKPIYVDSPRLFYPQKLLSAINTQLTGHKRRTALRYFERLQHVS